MLCTLKTFYNKKYKYPPTARELNYFSSGLGIHEAIQTLAQSDKKRFKKEKSVRYNKVEGHIDLYDQINKVPIEIKSIRKESSSEPMDYHIIQLKCYIAILGCDYGLLLYQLMLHKGDQPFVEYPIHTTYQERVRILHELDVRSTLLEEALKSGDPTNLPHIGKDENYEWMCNFCPHVMPCIEMRYEKLKKADKEKLLEVKQ